MRDRIGGLAAFVVVLVATGVAEHQGHPVTAITVVLIGIFWALFRIERHLSRGAEWLERVTRPKKDDEHVG